MNRLSVWTVVWANLERDEDDMRLTLDATAVFDCEQRAQHYLERIVKLWCEEHWRQHRLDLEEEWRDFQTPNGKLDTANWDVMRLFEAMNETAAGGPFAKWGMWPVVVNGEADKSDALLASSSASSAEEATVAKRTKRA